MLRLRSCSRCREGALLLETDVDGTPDAWGCLCCGASFTLAAPEAYRGACERLAYDAAFRERARAAWRDGEAA